MCVHCGIIMVGGDEDDGSDVVHRVSVLPAGVLPNWHDCLSCLCVSPGAKGSLRLPPGPLQ